MRGYITRSVIIASFFMFANVTCRPKRHMSGSYVHIQSGNTIVDYNLGSSSHSHMGSSESVSVSASDCKTGSFRAVPGTGCRQYQTCSLGKWYHEVMECPYGMVWGNDVTGCVFPQQLDLTTCTMKSNVVTECKTGSFRAVPGTGCTKYQTCSLGKWYHEIMMCPYGLVWGNDVTGCVFPQQLDLTTCTKKSSVASGSSNNYQHHLAALSTEPTTTTVKTTTTTRPTSTTTPTATTTTTTPTTPSTTRPTTPTTTTTTSTTPKTTTKTTQPTSSTTALPKHFNTCRMLATLNDIGKHVTVENKKIKACPSGSFATPEAFVIDHCNVTSPDRWRRGASVRQQCRNIPLYTPVATFNGNMYLSSGSLAGIFLGCVDNGFQIGVQPCERSPYIEHIEDGGIFTQDPQYYFTVQ